MVGDIILDEPDADMYFDFCRDTLKRGDVVIGHVEVPHTLRGTEQSTDVPAPPADPANLEALPGAGFNVVTLAGNHISDCGHSGVEDTIAKLNELGMRTCGAGMNIAEARRPVIVEHEDVRVGILSYNCVGPRESWATSKKSGCAYVRIITHFELEQATPGAPPAIYTFADPQSLDLMVGDIRELRPQCDILIVSLHKGVGHIPVHVCMYEEAVSHAAIDAGADIIVGHHAHIMRGIEVYRDKPIFHGLGNFVTVTHALAPVGENSLELQAWAAKREKLYGFKPVQNMPFYPFHPDSLNTIVAKCRVTREGVVEFGFIPCYMDNLARPHTLSPREDGRAVVEYVENISKAAGFSSVFEYRDSWVVLH